MRRYVVSNDDSLSTAKPKWRIWVLDSWMAMDYQQTSELTIYFIILSTFYIYDQVSKTIGDKNRRWKA